MGKDKKRQSRQCQNNNNVDRTKVDQPSSPIDDEEELKTADEEPEEDVMQLVLSEKAVAMNNDYSSASKIRSSMTMRQIREAASVAAPGRNTLESSSSSVTPPGAFRVSTTSSSQQVEQAAQDVQDDDSESCVFVIPTASLVQEKPPAKEKTRKKHVKIEKKDEIPVVIAEVTVAAAKDKEDSSEMKKKLRNKKIFRITVLVGVFLIMVLLIAVLAALLTKPDTGHEKGPDSNDNRPTTSRCDLSIDPLCLGCNPNIDPICPPPNDGGQNHYSNYGYGPNQNNGYGQNRAKDNFNNDPNNGGRYLRRHQPKIFD